MSALETDMPPAKAAPVNGLEMAYWEAGPREGVPVIFCHGFPELAYSWRHQLRAFEAAGRWAVAPDQRGYGLTGGAADTAAYDMEHLTGDLVGLLDHLGVEKAIFCGHDWGGIVAWQMPLLHPDRVAGVIGLNTPFLPRSPIDPIAAMRTAFGPDMYIVWFQTPEEPEQVLGADVEKTMRFFMRKPKALTWSFRSEDVGSKFAFKEMLQHYDARDDEGQFLSDEELAVFVEAFQRTGFGGGVNWYRNFTRNWERAKGLPNRIDGPPCLMITAEKDPVLRPAMAAPMPLLVQDLEMHEIKDCGHWTQQEEPEQVNRLILDWMDRRFPK
jgi:pimeloyl-ACP methyl ester carboxylesterase